MNGAKRKIDSLVQHNKVEKLRFIQYGQVRRHSRVLYLPIDPQIARIHHINKGDIIKYQLIDVRHAPDPDAPITEEGEL